MSELNSGDAIAATDLARRVRAEADTAIRAVYWRRIGVASGPLPGTESARRIDADIAALIDALFAAQARHGLVWLRQVASRHYPAFLAILLEIAPVDPRPWLTDQGVQEMSAAGAAVLLRNHRQDPRT